MFGTILPLIGASWQPLRHHWPCSTRERDVTGRWGGPLYSAAWHRLIGRRVSIEARAGFYTKPIETFPQGNGPSVAVYPTVFSSMGRLFSSGSPIVEMGNFHYFSRVSQQRSTSGATRFKAHFRPALTLASRIA